MRESDYALGEGKSQGTARQGRDRLAGCPARENVLAYFFVTAALAASASLVQTPFSL